MTSAGRFTLLAGVGLTALGVVSSYAAVVSMGVTLLLAVLLAIILSGRRADLRSDRTVRPRRVTAGDEAVTEITITNHSRRGTGPSVAYEWIGDRQEPINIPALDPGESVVVEHPLTTDHRGIYTVGPLVVHRSDPIGLAQRGDSRSKVDELIVHPFVHPVSPFPAGFRRDLEGLPSGEASAGGITFSNLREYVPGDDLRLVHWRSSARVGELMVRHNVDANRPRTSVVLDVSKAVYSDESFEDAVRSAASIVVAAMARRFPFTLRTTDGAFIDDRSSRIAVMDFLAGIERKETPDFDLGRAAFDTSKDSGGISCATFTGRAGVEVLRILAPLRHRFDMLTMVRMGASTSTEVHELSGAVLINAPTSREFADAWNRRMKR